MYLLLDLSEKDAIHLALFDEKNITKKEVSGRNRELLLFVDEFLREEHVKKEDVAGIMVVVGTGGFTSTRLATTLANTFAYAQQIPVLAITKEQIDETQQLIPELLKQPKGQYISATYSGEANIGGKGK
jgi:tRNA A37 threonylcarbamoyladenosine modification protein TsaB